MTWQERTNNDAFWNPEKVGEAVEGIIDGIAQTTEWGKRYVLATEEGEVTLPLHKVLQNRLEGTKVGDKVKVEFVGEELPKIKGHKPTRLYKVYEDINEVEEQNLSKE